MIKKRIRTRQENQIREKKAKMTVLYGLSSVRIEWVSRQQTIQEHLKEQERMISERQWKPGYSFHDFFATALVFPRLSSFILSRKTTKYLFGWSFRVDWCYGFCCIRVSCIPDQTSHLMILVFLSRLLDWKFQGLRSRTKSAKGISDWLLFQAVLCHTIPFVSTEVLIPEHSVWNYTREIPVSRKTTSEQK